MSNSSTLSTDTHAAGDDVVSTFFERVAGKTFLVTGPSENGIGGATVLALASGNPHTIILVGRSPLSLATMASKISQVNPAICVHMSIVDFASLQSVRHGAAALLNDTSIPRIHTVINNAAVAGAHGRTADEIEAHLHVNVVAPFLFTNLIMPKILKSGQGRVINVTDPVYTQARRDFAKYDSVPINFDPLLDGYALSKLGSVYLTLSLVKRFQYQGLKAFSAEPASLVLGTRIAIGKGITRSSETHTAQAPQQACTSILTAALDYSTPQGAYIIDCVPSRPAKVAQDVKKAEALWEICEKVVGQKFGQRTDWCIFGA
ncbi:NAD(P)-binding protein [Exidia glandulosa HHB12029]|uniref:NAD(P)-binding protein n=1 Tax=Exidia glandulosa HHB12029 TaxID=1314781 RepID=A0A165MKT9_EXIGL|nr:NAD(P)-binding protein [Exidia glandulosa HHB12029]